MSTSLRQQPAFPQAQHYTLSKDRHATTMMFDIYIYIYVRQAVWGSQTLSH